MKELKEFKTNVCKYHSYGLGGFYHIALVCRFSILFQSNTTNNNTEMYAYH